MEQKKYYNSEEVAKILGIGVNTLHILRRKGLIRAYILGYKTVRYDEAQINEYIANPLVIKNSQEA